MGDNMRKKAEYIIKNTILPKFDGDIVSVAITLNVDGKFPIEVKDDRNCRISFSFKNKNLAYLVVDILASNVQAKAK